MLHLLGHILEYCLLSLNVIFSTAKSYASSVNNLIKIIISIFVTCTKYCGSNVWTSLPSQVQELELASAYQNDNRVGDLVRQLMALSMIPLAEVRGQYQRLRGRAQTPAMQSLFDYFERTWLSSTTWSVSSWNMYKQAIRTNNDCEGENLRTCYIGLPYAQINGKK